MKTVRAEKITLASCMRNEGIFLLEWIAYHQSLGFDEVLIVTNGCTDHSDTLLDLLADHGVVSHIRQTLAPGDNPQNAGMDLALTHLRSNGTEWCLHIDSDEFLLIEVGAGLLADLMPYVQRADVVPFTWRNFGDNGLSDWIPGENVLEKFTRAEPAAEPGQSKSKCLFRVASFARATDHNPRAPLIDDPKVLTPDGEALSNKTLAQGRSSRFRPHDIACRARNARLNHYAVKSEDLFLMKNDRGDGQGKLGEVKYHLGSPWHRKANRNDVEDRAILRHWPATQARLEALRALPGVRAAEQACRDWFHQRRNAILTPEQRALWTRKRPAT